MAPTREEPSSHRTIGSHCGSAHDLSHQGAIALQDTPYIFLSYNGCYWAGAARPLSAANMAERDIVAPRPASACLPFRFPQSSEIA